MLEFFIPAVLRTKGNSMKIYLRRQGSRTRRWIGPTEEQKDAEQVVRLRSLPHAPREPLTGPLRMDVTTVVPIPKSYSDDKRELCLLKEVRPDTPDKGDRGNHLKLLEDALEGIFYVNDAQICEGNVAKVFGLESGYRVRISALSDLQQ